MTHGLTDAQFFEKVSSFLGPYYIVLAAMNGLAALYLWRTGKQVVWLRLGLGEKKLPITNVVAWLLLGALFVGLAAPAASKNGDWMPSMPESIRDFIDTSTAPVIYSISTTVAVSSRPMAGMTRLSGNSGGLVSLTRNWQTGL